MRPTWAEVSLERLRHNYRIVQKHLGDGVTICAVIKADAYGHGVQKCGLALEAEGATWLGVTSTEEAVRVREAGVKARILLMSGFWRGEQEDVIRLELTPTVWEWWQIGALEAAAEKMGKAPGSVPVHMKVDTGMARLGVPRQYWGLFLRRIQAAKALELEGVATHLASSEVVDAPDVEKQAQNFEDFLAVLKKAGVTPKHVHVANSAATETRPATWKNMVRPGLALYGYHLPFVHKNGEKAADAKPLPVKPVLSWKTRIISLRDIPAGQAVGYNGIFVSRSPMRLAVLPLGYADGLNRKLSNRGRVILRNSYAPIVGNISMDLTMIDVTGLPAATVGDEVILIGESENCHITAWEHAEMAQTTVYEILCRFSSRTRREFV